VTPSSSLKDNTPITAGRGIFVDGFVPAGSTLALFPGQIWPKEHLLPLTTNTSKSNTDLHDIHHTDNVVDDDPIIAFFQNDPNHHLSLRYDDVLIDSRSSPYTVLDNLNSNPFALAHIANHPPPLTPPNCVTVTVDYTEKMMGSSGLERFVPNTYARPPNPLGPKLFERDVVQMQGFGLVASRDIEDEELYYDYRLSPGGGSGGDGGIYPEWYHVVDEDELKNRWSPR